MIIGVPKEIKDNEFRVGMVPSGVRAAVEAGHSVIIEQGAGIGSSITDAEYAAAGAEIVERAEEVYSRAGIVIKVKEPLHSEFKYLREKLILFTYLHLAAEPEVTQALLEKKVTGIAYETIELEDKSKPLLKPMSEVAGRMAVQIGMHYLERTTGGSGRLLAGVTGVAPGKVTIIGSGVAVMNAARIAHGIGAEVTIIGIIESELIRRMPTKLIPIVIVSAMTRPCVLCVTSGAASKACARSSTQPNRKTVNAWKRTLLPRLLALSHSSL